MSDRDLEFYKKANEKMAKENAKLKKLLDQRDKKIEKLQKRAQEKGETFFCEPCKRHYANKRSFRFVYGEKFIFLKS